MQSPNDYDRTGTIYQVHHLTPREAYKLADGLARQRPCREASDTRLETRIKDFRHYSGHDWLEIPLRVRVQYYCHDKRTAQSKIRTWLWGGVY